MNIPPEIGTRAIRDVIKDHPEIGRILAAHQITCVECQVGICLFKDVLAIHGTDPEESAAVEKEINGYLAGKEGPK